jgi:hypothetical protein
MRANRVSAELGTCDVTTLLYSGASHGALSWFIYAVLECGFAIVAPWLLRQAICISHSISGSQYCCSGCIQQLGPF